MILSGLIGSEMRIQILFYLANKKSYIREIELALDLPLFAVQTQLKRLEKEGILKKSKIGERKYYEYNQKYKLYKEVLNLMRRASKYYKIKDINGNYKNYHRFGKNTPEFKKWRAKNIR